MSANACALLIESRAATSTLLQEQLAQIMASLVAFPVEKQVDFTEDPVENAKLWAIRKDTFPAVGAVRKTGTTVIIEDVTFPVEQLAIGVNRLIELFDKHHYDEAILFGQWSVPDVAESLPESVPESVPEPATVPATGPETPDPAAVTQVATPLLWTETPKDAAPAAWMPSWGPVSDARPPPSLPKGVRAAPKISVEDMLSPLWMVDSTIL